MLSNNDLLECNKWLKRSIRIQNTYGFDTVRYIGAKERLARLVSNKTGRHFVITWFDMTIII